MTPALMLSTAIVFAVASVLGLIAVTAFRTRARPLGFWLFAWTAHLSAAGLVLVTFGVPSIRPVTFVFSSLVAPLMLAGAYEHAKRPAPSGLFALGIGLGAARVAAYQLGVTELGTILAAVVEPALGATAAVVVARATPTGVRTRGDTLLTLGLAAYAVCELADAGLRFTAQSNWFVWSVWLALCMPLFAAQLWLYMRRLARGSESDRQIASDHAERLRILTESSGSIVVEYDVNGVLTYVSRSAERVMGARVEDVIGRNASDYFDGVGDSVIKAALDEKGYITEEDISAAKIETQRARLPSGETFYYEALRTTYRTPSGELRILSQARNVTNRVEREQALRESARRLNRSEAIGQFGSWEYLPHENVTYWSDQLYRMHGLEPSAGPLDRDAIHPLVSPGDIDHMTENALGLIEGRMFPEFEYSIRRADDGETRYFRTRGEVEYGDDDEIVRVSGASIDVTDRRELEAALRRGREYLDTLVNANIVGVFYARLDGTIIEANDAFLSVLGFTSDDLPLNWRALTPIEGHARDEVALRDLTETGTSLPYEKEFYSSSGVTVPMVIACARIEPGQAIVIALDISERKRAEAFVAAEQLRLEETVSERTHELLESRSRLSEAERLAAVGTLAAGVAHQINNPIGAILNSAEYALLCAEDEDAIRIFQEALASNLGEAQRCARIVKSMLQFSRDEPTEKWEEDLDRVIRHAHRAIAAYAQDRDAGISLKLPAAPLRATISPIEIEQAIVNILRNAIESAERGVRVEIALSRMDSEAVIEIADDGRGIDEADRIRLFEPFYSTRTREGGTGLGLSVAHGIVSDHGGEIEIESDPGKGTRVRILLPLGEEATATGAPGGD